MNSGKSYSNSTFCYSSNVCKILFVFMSINYLVITGCSQYKVISKDSEPATDIIQTQTVHSILWGLILIPPAVFPENCQKNGLAETTVKTNFWYTAVSVITLGIYTPMEVTWRCAKDTNNRIDIGSASKNSDNRSH